MQTTYISPSMYSGTIVSSSYPGGTTSMTIGSSFPISGSTYVTADGVGIITVTLPPEKEDDDFTTNDHKEFTEHPDFTLIIGEHKFYTNRKKLSETSSVFNSMLTDKESSEVELEDCNPHIVREYLRYIYTPKWSTYHINKSHLVELTYFCFKYDISTLLKKCESLLAEDESLTEETLLPLYDKCRLSGLYNSIIKNLHGMDSVSDQCEKLLKSCRNETLVSLITGLVH